MDVVILLTSFRINGLRLNHKHSINYQCWCMMKQPSANLILNSVAFEAAT